jgi:ABC-type phosphate transport system substrate-binding protein
MKLTKISLALAGLMAVAPPFAAAQQRINAAGATFPAVIYQKWFD